MSDDSSVVHWTARALDVLQLAKTIRDPQEKAELVRIAEMYEKMAERVRERERQTADAG